MRPPRTRDRVVALPATIDLRPALVRVMFAILVDQEPPR